MTQLGEPVAIAVIDESQWECPFAHDKPGKVKNQLENDAGKLERRVRRGVSTQLWAEEGGKIVAKARQKLAPPVDETVDCPEGSVDVDGGSYPYSISAHHLIPGNEALPNSDILKYLESGAEVWGDVGYDINGAENGIWLPTHSSLSTEMKQGRLLPGETAPLGYADLTAAVEKANEENAVIGTFQQRYTYQVMERTGRQFHDRHLDYSNEVIGELNKIAAKMTVVAGMHCDKCKNAKKVNGKLPPPHPIVGRLNALSRRLAGHLWGNPLRWKSPYFTSRFAREMAADALIWKQMGR